MGVAGASTHSGFSIRQVPDHSLEVLTTLGFGIPLAVYIWFLHHYTLNVVQGDQWADVHLIGASYDGHLTLAALWAQHHENRIFFPNLMVLAMSRVDAFNISAEEYLSAGFLFAAIALIIVAHKRRSPDRRWIAYCPVVILMTSLAQAQNTLWGFQLAWYLVLLSLAGVIFILDHPSCANIGTVGAMILAVVGSYSSFQGLLIWVAGLLLLFYRRRSLRLMAAWVAAGVATTALYFYNIDTNAAVPSYLTARHFPREAVRFYFQTIGDVLGVPLRSNNFGADVIAAVGCVIVALALFTLWSSGRRRDAQSAAPVGMALTVFGLLFALSTTWGRAWAGPAAASASRYTTFDLLVLVGAYLTYIARPRVAGPTRGPSRTVTGLVGAVLGCVIIFVAVFGLVNGIRWTRSSDSLVEAAVTVDIDHIAGPLVPIYLEEAVPPGQLRDDAHVLAAHGLSLYSDPQAVARYRHAAALYTQEGLFTYKPPPPTRIEMPTNGSILSGTSLLITTAIQNLHPARVTFVLSGGAIPQRVIATKQTDSGWAVRWKTSSVPNGVYFLQSVVDTTSGKTISNHRIVVFVRNEKRSAR